MADITTLMRELMQGTERGAVPWEETVEEETFLATLKSASLKIELRPGTFGETIKMEIRDIGGKLIERVSVDWDENEAPSALAHALKRIHLGARRKALDADSKIENLLSELQAS